MMETTNAVSTLGAGMANALGSSLYDGLDNAYQVLEGDNLLGSAQSALASILLLFVGIAALYYVGRWLYKAFKRGAA